MDFIGNMDEGLVKIREYILAFDEDGNIVGMIQFSHSTQFPGFLSVGFVTVQPEHCNRGIATKMIAILGKCASDRRRLGIYPGVYTGLGNRFIREKMEMCGRAFNLTILH